MTYKKTINKCTIAFFFFLNLLNTEKSIHFVCKVCQQIWKEEQNFPKNGRKQQLFIKSSIKKMQTKLFNWNNSRLI